jgi:YVTN family beta-propeller protein
VWRGAVQLSTCSSSERGSTGSRSQGLGARAMSDAHRKSGLLPREGRSSLASDDGERADAGARPGSWVNVISQRLAAGALIGCGVGNLASYVVWLSGPTAGALLVGPMTWGWFIPGTLTSFLAINAALCRLGIPGPSFLLVVALVPSLFVWLGAWMAAGSRLARWLAIAIVAVEVPASPLLFSRGLGLGQWAILGLAARGALLLALCWALVMDRRLRTRAGPIVAVASASILPPVALSPAMGRPAAARWTPPEDGQVEVASHGTPRVLLWRRAGVLAVVSLVAFLVFRVVTGPTATLRVGSWPGSPTVAADGTVYVASTGNDTLSVISGGQVTATIGVGRGPQSPAVAHLQFEAMLSAARDSTNRFDFALVAMLGLLGLRIFEASGANIEDLGEEHGHRVLKVRGKGGKVVLTPLPPAVARAIDKATEHRVEGPVLLNRRGVRMDRHAATRRLVRLAETANVRLPRMHPHMLRHTFVTTMLDAGVDLRDVQIAARHADPRTTMRYDRARKNLDRHPNYILAAYMASGT